MARHKRLFSKDNPLSHVTEEPKSYGNKEYALGLKPPHWSSRAQRSAFAEAREKGQDVTALRDQFARGEGPKRG